MVPFFYDSHFGLFFELPDSAASLAAGTRLVSHPSHPHVWTGWCSPWCRAPDAELAPHRPLMIMCEMKE